LEDKAAENKQKTKDFHKKQREERKKLLETQPEGGFHMDSMEEQLRQLEGLLPISSLSKLSEKSLSF
jgi:hypothetical protein